MDVKRTIESLSANEIKIIPYLEKRKIGEICKASELSRVAVLRALKFLEKKSILEISYNKEKIIDLGNNGVMYKKSELPERKLVNLLMSKHILLLEEAKKLSDLTDEEFKASIGILKNKGFIELKNGKILLNTNKEDISKKTDEEILIESLPLSYSKLNDEQKEVLKNLQRRKEIVIERGRKTVDFELTSFGKEILKSKIRSDLIEQVTPEILKKDSSWKGKKFRRYDVLAFLPEVHGGKRHFVNQASDYARKIWTDMGFKEMEGSMIESSFWVFDALFTPQDHPAREMQDTFFLGKKAEIHDKKLAKFVKDSHEGNLKNLGSKGWQYDWDEEEAKKLVLRTHTTSLSVRTLADLKNKNQKLQGKFFALGKVFRNETVDWKHGFEFNQTEGIVIDKNANFRHLLGYLKQFFNKMGFLKIRFRPSFFAYTEPSVEIEVYHEGRKEWLELGGAGIFRPEVVVPLLGENIPVLAWGPGFDRILMDYYNVKDLRELYSNDLNQLRKIKFWMKT